MPTIRAILWALQATNKEIQVWTMRKPNYFLAQFAQVQVFFIDSGPDQLKNIAGGGACVTEAGCRCTALRFASSGWLQHPLVWTLSRAKSGMEKKGPISSRMICYISGKLHRPATLFASTFPTPWPGIFSSQFMTTVATRASNDVWLG